MYLAKIGERYYPYSDLIGDRFVSKETAKKNWEGAYPEFKGTILIVTAPEYDDDGVVFNTRWGFRYRKTDAGYKVCQN